MTNYNIVIPARMASTRLPRKMLADIHGKPMIQHVYEKAKQTKAKEIIVATDHEEIFGACQKFGAKVCMTSEQHTSGTERVAEIAAQLHWLADQIVVNVQGDEVLIPPAVIDQTAEDMAAYSEADVSTLYTPIIKHEEIADPSCVKVIRNKLGYAIYFSRAPIPWDREGKLNTPKMDSTPATNTYERHIGIYAFRVETLNRYVKEPKTHLESWEVLEQLRVLWYGGKIHLAQAVEPVPPGVDQLSDLENVRKILYEG